LGSQKIKFEYFSWRDLTDCCWIAFYEFGKEIGVKYKKEDWDGLQNYKKIASGGAMMSILLDGMAIVCRRPKRVCRDAQNRLHCENGPAVTWIDGYENWFWHGTSVIEKIIMKPQDITKEEILAEKNSEISRAIAEKLGWEEYLKRVDSVLIDKWFDCATKSHYELYDFKTRKGSMMPRLLKMESPDLKDGTRPYYIEPVDPGLKTAQAARKWQFALPNGEWPTVDEANRNPELVFAWEA